MQVSLLIQLQNIVCVTKTQQVPQFLNKRSPAYLLKHANVSVSMLIGLTSHITLRKQLRPWILRLLYSAFGETQDFHLFCPFTPTNLSFTEYYCYCTCSSSNQYTKELNIKKILKRHFRLLHSQLAPMNAVMVLNQINVLHYFKH